MLHRPKDEFFARMADLELSLTYDDVRLCTGYTEVLPDEVSVTSHFTKNVPLKIPIVSAAMDTVTKHSMAIAIAKLGGLGVIHRSLSVKAQAREVARVKHHLHGMITKPKCVRHDQTVGEVLAHRRRKNYRFHSFPVVDNNSKLVGVLTGNDFDFCVDRSLPVTEVMSHDLITAPPETTLEEAFQLMLKERRKLLPIVNEEGGLVALYTFTDAKRIICNESANFNLDDDGQLRVGAAIGVGREAIERATVLLQERADVLVIDTAHGDTRSVAETLRQLKQEFPSAEVMVGNITESSSAQRLCDAGADGIKVGQGPGSICTTRIVAGFGCPQVTAVYQCSVVAEQYGVPVCADGGIRYSGDIPVAIVAGAHSVMLGQMLAGTKESPGRIILRNGRQWKTYYGMGSIEALKKSRAARQRYQQTNGPKKTLIPQGVKGLVAYKGEAALTIEQCVGGLRHGMAATGAHNVEELRKSATLRRHSPAAQTESHPHDVTITEEAPNYQGR